MHFTYMYNVHASLKSYIQDNGQAIRYVQSIGSGSGF